MQESQYVNATYLYCLSNPCLHGIGQTIFSVHVRSCPWVCEYVRARADHIEVSAVENH